MDHFTRQQDMVQIREVKSDDGTRTESKQDIISKRITSTPLGVSISTNRHPEMRGVSHDFLLIYLDPVKGLPNNNLFN